ncbi:hypothetical protein LCGC14_0663140 [marine sediment metagenome]|uniref:Uncharacterized protein n=1 Tax=marine sediment metagenome TaxID=412755 RepID=A0A0F9TEC7_9ZZZZ
MARFSSKAKRNRAPKRSNINFDDYSWDTPKEAGWHPLVVLYTKETTTGKGDTMWVVHFGVDLPGGDKSRILWNVPFAFAPKLEMLQSVLLADRDDGEDDYEAEPRDLMFRTCVGLIEIDENYQRDDGQESWQVAKIIKESEADAQLGVNWRGARAAEAGGEQDESDVFGGGDDAEEPLSDLPPSDLPF